MDRLGEDLYEVSEGVRSSLHACSLVCRSWLPRARKNAFCHVVLWNKNINTVKSVLRSNPSLGLLVLDCFLELQDPGRAYFLREPLSCSMTSLLLVCITYFPNIRHLSMYFWAGLTREHGDIYKLISYLPNITTVTISTFKPAPYSVLCRLLSCFKSVRYVSTSGFNLPFITPLSSHCVMAHKIERFCLDFRGDGASAGIVPFVTWLLNTQVLKTFVRRVAISMGNDEKKGNNIPTMNWVIASILGESGSSLTHFYFSIRSGYFDPLWMNGLIGEFPALYTPLLF